LDIEYDGGPFEHPADILGIGSTVTAGLQERDLRP
jgi:hypothetical protein